MGRRGWMLLWFISIFRKELESSLVLNLTLQRCLGEEVSRMVGGWNGAPDRYLLPISFRAGRAIKQHFGQRLVQTEQGGKPSLPDGGARRGGWQGYVAQRGNVSCKGPFLFSSYITVLFSRDRLRSSRAGSTATRAFDVGLNSSRYVPFIFLSQPPTAWSNHQRLSSEILMCPYIHPHFSLSFPLVLSLDDLTVFFPFPSWPGCIVCIVYIDSLWIVNNI